MSAPDLLLSETSLPRAEAEILKAVRELSFGVVEVVVHNHRVTEIRQTRRTRIEPVSTVPVDPASSLSGAD